MLDTGLFIAEESEIGSLCQVFHKIQSTEFPDERPVLFTCFIQDVVSAKALMGPSRQSESLTAQIESYPQCLRTLPGSF
ncbi:hypothetical protein LshimejAT787_0212060 [Lyophyllum shimeji]|uniref:Uncharacterized protein n=1 Tax=Lyophyllum shimeji TaxID=47721 RepID=A0A9P3PHM1_LYOSH|nr:hypothetical protein LshimejAT787_0212060 [Lyophyllum shimeji]